MNSFKKFAFIALVPIFLIAIVSILISQSFEDVSHLNINFYVFGYFTIVSFCYVYIFEKIKKRNQSTILNYGYSLLILFPLLFIFSCVTFYVLFSGFEFNNALFKTTIGICIFLTITFIFEIYNQSGRKEVLTIREKPFFFLKLVAVVLFTFSLLHCIMESQTILSPYGSISGTLRLIKDIFILHLQISLSSFIVLLLLYKILFLRKNVIFGVFIASVVSCLINSYFDVLWAKQFYFNFIIIYPICLFCCATIVITLIYRNKIQNLSLSFIKKETEYLQLKNQVNPHFLFNNLNTLIAFIETNPQKAIAFGHQLSNVYRHYLNNEKDDFILLADEIEFISEYAAIFKAKFESGFTFEVENQVRPEQYILVFSVQELMDNIFKHTILDAENPIAITISIHSDELVVTNTNHKKVVLNSSKKGLQNINKRYQLLTKKEITIKETANFFEVRIPILYLTK
jgi:two-component system LytT family sensor kinase